MAITKIHGIKSTLSKAIDYITDQTKTEYNGLISTYNCEVMTAHLDFKMTEILATEIIGNHSNGNQGNIAYHMIQSFSKDDNVDYKKAHELGVKLADKLLEGKYEYIVSTHIDKGHIHNHIIFNATSFYDYKKFRSEPYKTVRKIREISDKLCIENNLSVIKEEKLSYTRDEYNLNKNYKKEIVSRLNFILENCNDYNEFKIKAKELNVIVDDRGKYIKFKYDDQQKFSRGKNLDKEGSFEKENILEKIEDNKRNNKNLDDINIKEEYEKKNNTTKDNNKNLNEVKLIIDKKIIDKVTSKGIVLNVDDKKIFVNSYNLNNLQNENFELFLKSNSKFNIVGENSKEKQSLFGEQVIRNIELENNIKPKEIILENKSIKFFNKKGIVINYGQGDIFIENNFIDYDKNNGQVKIKVYDNWTYKSNIENKTNYINGKNLFESLESHEAQYILKDKNVIRRLEYVDKTNKLKDTKKLTEILQFMREKNINTLEDFKTNSDMLKNKTNEIKKDIKNIEEKNINYKEVAKNLVTYNKFLPLKLQYDKKSFNKKSFFKKNESELMSFEYAQKKLENLNVSTNVDSDKVIELIKKNDNNIEILKNDINNVEKEIKKITDTKNYIDEILKDNLEIKKSKTIEKEIIE